MDELEITQPEDNLDAGDAAEAAEVVEVEEVAEAQSLDDVTHEPGAVIEETQTFEQAEAVESALSEAVEAAQAASVGELPLPLPQPADEGGEHGGVLPLPIPEPALEDDSETPNAIGYDETPPSAEELPITLVDSAQEGEALEEQTILDESGREQVEGLPLPVFNPAKEEQGDSQDLSPGVDGNEVELPIEPGGSGPGPNHVAETNDPPDPEGPNLDLDLNSEPGLSPGFDGNVAETNDPPDPKGPNLGPERSDLGDARGLSPGVDGNVAETNDPPDPEGPNLELELNSEPGLSLGVDGNFAEEPELANTFQIQDDAFGLTPEPDGSFAINPDPGFGKKSEDPDDGPSPYPRPAETPGPGSNVAENPGKGGSLPGANLEEQEVL